MTDREVLTVHPERVYVDRAAIGKLCLARGIPLAELARKIGVTPQSMSHWNRGLLSTVENFQAVAEALGVQLVVTFDES